MAVAKVTINGTTILDLTDATASADKILNTYTAYIQDGTKASGTLVPASEPTLQSKTKSYTPSETAQSETVTADSGYDGLSEVSIAVGAISSTYVGSGIARKSSSDLSVSGATVTVPTGYYSSDASKSVASGTAGTPTATKGTVSNHSVSVTPSVTNTTGYIAGSTKTGTAVSVSASELVSGTKSITTNGTGIDVTNYASVDVAVPTEEPSLQSKTKSYTPSETAQSETVTADSGYDGLSSVSVSVGAISSTYVGSGIARKSSSDLTASGATVTAPAGYYSSAASKSVASMTLPTTTASSATSGYTSKATVSRSTSDQYINIPTGYNASGAYYKVEAVANGTAGTPTATKGTVSNHSVSVTPSVTNTTGYITGGTKNGTAVSVSASELVSGTRSITANGTGIDVTNYASVDVAVPIVTYFTGTGNPSASTGSNGDIYLKTVS